jgi:hypothetical protein
MSPCAGRCADARAAILQRQESQQQAAGDMEDAAKLVATKIAPWTLDADAHF